MQNVTGNPTSVSHTFASGPNDFSISASAITAASSFPTNTISVQVDHIPPTVSISGAASVNEGASGHTLSLSGTEAGPHTISSWTINWGDGSAPQIVTDNPSSVTHTFAAGPNNYTISASAADDAGTYASSDTVAVAVNHVVPQLSISGSSTTNETATYTLNLSGSETGPHTISSWTINWGDGQSNVITGNPSTATHVYADGPNNYTIRATATDDVATYFASDTVAVQVNHIPPTLSISGPSTTNETAVYTLNLSGSETGPHVLSSWTINWGDGQTQTITGNPSTATHVYADGPHNYTITASATDDVSSYSAGTLAVEVDHLARTLGISGPSSINEASVYTLDLAGLEPGPHTISH